MINDADSNRITVIICEGHYSWTGPREGVVCGLGIKTKKTSCSNEVSFLHKLPSVKGLFL